VLSVAQIRKLTCRPFGYLPIRIQTGKKPVQPFFLRKDEKHAPAFPLHFIEITETEGQAQELLEFYLRQREDNVETGKVLPFKFEDAIACLVHAL
jgi:hypothetical protein